MPIRMKGMALPELYPILKTIEMSPYLAILIGGLLAAFLLLSYPTL